MSNTRYYIMNRVLTLILIYLASNSDCVSSLKHHLILTNDFRYQVSVSSFGYNVGGRLDVIVQNLTLNPDPGEEEEDAQYGFALVKTDQARNPYAARPFQQGTQQSCLLTDPRNQFKFDLMTLAVLPRENKVLVRCTGDISVFPPIKSLTYSKDRSIHHQNVRAAVVDQSPTSDSLYHKCPHSSDLPLESKLDNLNHSVYSFNFTMLIQENFEEGTYYLSFHNCRGYRGPLRIDALERERNTYTMTRFNISVLVSETNYPDNYLSAGAIPLPQMYFMLSVMFFIIGSIWINYITRQKDFTLKIHKLMAVLVFAKACSLLFHGINYHYIALYGQPVVTWAYLYYATRSVKGALFFITLALIGSGWTFVKHMISPREKKIILMIVALQVIAHVAEIVLDESTEGEASIEFWAELCGLVDLFSCIVILIPITWSVRHLEEASRTDGKAAMNLKKMELFKRFYVISTIYIYVTRIMTFVFLSMLVYKYSWLAELFSEMATLVYLVITGYYFQPMQTNPYLLLSTENDEEDILFSVDAPDMHDSVFNDDELSKRRDHRHIVEDFV